MAGPNPEPIAALVADLRAGHVRLVPFHERVRGGALERAQRHQPVVDVSHLYWDLHRRLDVGVQVDDLIADACVTPPWTDALLCYVNSHGNAVALQVHSDLWKGRPGWEEDHPVDWTQMRWFVETMMWVGGRDSDGTQVPTTGPTQGVHHAVYPDGRTASIRAFKLYADGDDQAGGTWGMPVAVLCSALNFLNCSNVELAEPARPRPQRRRLARTGVTVQTIVVRPPGKRTRSSGVRAADSLDTPLTSVRGHFAHYGPSYNRGKMFGKYEGKFWIPGYARGAGESAGKDYILKP